MQETSMSKQIRGNASAERSSISKRQRQSVVKLGGLCIEAAGRLEQAVRAAFSHREKCSSLLYVSRRAQNVMEWVIEQDEKTVLSAASMASLAHELLNYLELGVTRVLKYGQQAAVCKLIKRTAAHKGLDDIRKELERCAAKIEDALDSMEDPRLKQSFRRTFSRVPSAAATSFSLGNSSRKSSGLKSPSPQASYNIETATKIAASQAAQGRGQPFLSGAVSRKQLVVQTAPPTEEENGAAELGKDGQEGEEQVGLARTVTGTRNSEPSEKSETPFGGIGGSALTERKRILRGMNFKVQCMAYSEELAKLWWCTRTVENNLGNAISVYDIAEGRRSTLQASTGCSSVKLFHFDEQGGLWTGHADGDLRLWDAGSGKMLLKSRVSSSSLTAVITNLPLSEVWTGSRAGNLRVIRFHGDGGGGALRTWKQLQGRKGGRPHPGGVRCMIRTQGGRLSRVWSAGREGGIKVWDLDTFELLNHLDADSPHGEVCRMVEVDRHAMEGALDEDGCDMSKMPEIVITAHQSGQVVLWDVDELTPLHVLGLKGSPAKALSVRNGLISTGHKDGWMHLWKLKAEIGSMDVKPLCAAAHRSSVLCILHIGDGLLTSTRFGTIRFWPLDDLQAGFKQLKRGILRQGTLYLRSTSTICLENDKVGTPHKARPDGLGLEDLGVSTLGRSADPPPDYESLSKPSTTAANDEKTQDDQERNAIRVSVDSFALGSIENDPPLISLESITEEIVGSRIQSREDLARDLPPNAFSSLAVGSGKSSSSRASPSRNAAEDLKENIAAVTHDLSGSKGSESKPPRGPLSAASASSNDSSGAVGVFRPNHIIGLNNTTTPAPPGRWISDRLVPLDSLKHLEQDSSPKSNKEETPRKSSLGSKPLTPNQSFKSVASDSSLNANIELNWSDIELVKMIGQGSFGQVYKGNWRSNEVAVKVMTLNEKSQEKELATFRKEVELLASVRCPNVVLFMGACSRPPQLAMVMEFCGRGSLFELLENHRGDPSSGVKAKPLLWTRRLQIALEVALGMNYLHTCSPAIIHRDLKSPNIMISTNWQAKVGDLGMSRIMEYSLISGTVSMCSPRWMAPEVLKGEDYDTSSDVYSFGIILWELATLSVPYEDAVHPYQMVHQITEEDKRPELPEATEPPFDGLDDLNRLIQDCWSTDPAKRPISSEVVLRVRKLVECAWKMSVEKRKSKVDKAII